jgi:protein TonB
VFLSADIDDPPVAIAVSPPRYPPAMESAGIPGRVEAQFVIDTLGHVDPSSFKVIKTTHQAFVEPAREAVLKTLFRPGKNHGQVVAVLVQQAISFKQSGQ